jgi:A/G-specific adenine glycosylase
MASKDLFASTLLEWFDSHGRHELPWQNDPSAYAVWVSEIMLQQTQVATVIPYFERFMARFTDATALAAASLDDVLAHWSGLGYYARARNLHSAARIVRDEHGGIVPNDFDSLIALPGIGRSTAGAILSIAFDARYPILDGNVKRVLARRAGIEEWPGQSAVTKHLWQLADELTPYARIADYTQAIMDLGALLCTRTRPSCVQCPVIDGCRAQREGKQELIPAPKPKVHKPRRSVRMLVLQDASGAVLLERRPPAGIWAGLYSLPEVPQDASISAWSREYIGIRVEENRRLDTISHSFTHFDLDIEPLLAEIASQERAMDRVDLLWYKPGRSQRPGMPAPISRLLENLPRPELN